MVDQTARQYFKIFDFYDNYDIFSFNLKKLKRPTIKRSNVFYARIHKIPKSKAGYQRV